MESIPHREREVYYPAERGFFNISRITGSNPALIANSSSSSGTVPDNLRWYIEPVTGGGKLLRNVGTGLYLCQSSDSAVSCAIDTEPPSIDSYDKCVWRVTDINYYGNTESHSQRELTSAFSISDMALTVGEAEKPTVNKSPTNAIWAEPKDFTYSLEYSSPAGCVSCNNSTYQIEANGAGEATVRATHKVSGLSKTFSISVNCPAVTVPCVYGTAPSYSNTISFPVYLNNYISEYSSLLSETVWYAYENDVITFNSQDMTVMGKASGFAWLEAKKNGQTVFICYLYSDNILKDFSGSVRDYLYLNGTYLGTISCYEYDQNHKIDPLILRTEWYLYAVKLLKSGKTTEQIRTELNEKFKLNLEGNELFRLLISEVECGSQGGYARDKIKLSFDGLRDFLNFFWLHYANAMIATIDTVNVYTPATQLDVAEEMQYAKRLCQESRETTAVIQQALTNNPSKTTVVIGTNYNGVSWNEVGKQLNAKYFYGENYDIYNSAHPYETQAANNCFLKDALYSGNTIYCSHDPSVYFDIDKGTMLINTAFSRELNLIYGSCISMSFGSPQIINGYTVWPIFYII